MLTLTINRQADQPVYEQVADQVRRLIASGELAVGTVLPPVRRLAGDLGVGLNTIARAYRALTDEGFLVTKDRAGVRVAAPALRPTEPQPELIEGLRVALARLKQAGISGDELSRMATEEISALGNEGERE